MISEGSRDTEDWSSDAENTGLLKNIHFKNVQIYIFFIVITQYYSFYCIFDQINEALVSIRYFF